MPNIVAFEDVKATRIERVTDDNKRAWRTNYMVPPDEAPNQPQAFLAEMSAHRNLRTHFHANDQFQIFVSGDGHAGKHPIAPFQVHFARAYTPYGPIIAKDAGVGFLTLRTRKDGGAQFLPEKRDQLLQVEGRQAWQLTVPVTFPKASRAIAVEPLEGMHDDRGLGAHAISMKPNAQGLAPDPAHSNGQYIVVLGGSLVHEGKEHKATTIIFVQPEEGAFNLVAGGEGLEAVALHFPLPELPIVEAQPAADADGEFKVWHCVLCAFVYDEAAGLPEDGIPPGTRWADVPENWGCPDCSAKKSDFEMVEF
jgi:rubredoxin